jgi:hypothetical protein
MDKARENRTVKTRNFIDISLSLFCMKIKVFGCYHE